ncbi:hypothetical protein SMICM304S_01425 [Streptomyces microflavus]
MTAGRSADDYPWFDAVTTLAGGGGHLFTGRLSLDDGPWLADHVVGGQVYVQGAGLVDAALFAARTAGADAVADLTLLEPVVLLPGRALRIQATVGDPDAHGRRPFAFYSQPEDTDEPLTWQQHVTGECVTRARVGGALPPDIDNWPVPEARALDIEAFYGRALANGLDYGLAFRGLRELTSRDGVSYRAVCHLLDALDPAGHGLHPSLFDAALQVVVAGLMEGGAGAWAARPVHLVGRRAVPRRRQRTDGAPVVRIRRERGPRACHRWPADSSPVAPRAARDPAAARTPGTGIVATRARQRGSASLAA